MVAFFAGGAWMIVALFLSDPTVQFCRTQLGLWIRWLFATRRPLQDRSRWLTRTGRKIEPVASIARRWPTTRRSHLISCVMSPAGSGNCKIICKKQVSIMTSLRLKCHNASGNLVGRTPAFINFHALYLLVPRISAQSIAFLCNRGRLDSILGIIFFNFQRKKQLRCFAGVGFLVAPRCRVVFVTSCLQSNPSIFWRWRFLPGKLLCKTWVKGKHKPHCWHSLPVQREALAKNTTRQMRTYISNYDARVNAKSIGIFVTSTMWNYCKARSLVSCS